MQGTITWIKINREQMRIIKRIELDENGDAYFLILIDDDWYKARYSTVVNAWIGRDIPNGKKPTHFAFVNKPKTK